MRTFMTALLGSVILLLAPAAAVAQGYVTAFVGGNFGGDTGVSLDESINDRSKLDFGARLGAMGAGILGGEVDLGVTRNFYGKGTIFDSTNVFTAMGNLLVGLPLGPVRPYVLAGAGLIRRTVKYAPGEGIGDVTDSRAAYDLGGGVSIFFSEHVGLNGDLRYFRNFSTGNEILDLPNEHFKFARGTVGLTVKF